MHKKILIMLSACMLTFAACSGKEQQGENAQVPAVEATQIPEKSVEVPTEAPTEVPTEAPTEAPTEVPTEAPTATPTQAPVVEEQEESNVVDKKVITETLCPEDICIKKAGVGYGTVEHITYYSETTGLERGANVLLPAGYTTDKKYPVLYFQHGIFGDEHVMLNDKNNKIIEILGNLAADGRAKEAIVVFGNMYATSDPNQKPAFSPEAVLPYDNFINDLVNDLIPYIESHYSTLTDRENRAVLGFSMGGRETLFIGLSRPDLFGYIGAIAPAPGLTPGKDFAMTHVGQLKEEELRFKENEENLPELLMVCCGTKDGVVGKFPKGYHELMEKNGVEHTWYEVPGADHDSKAIKSGLYNFMIRWN